MTSFSCSNASFMYAVSFRGHYETSEGGMWREATASFGCQLKRNQVGNLSLWVVHCYLLPTCSFRPTQPFASFLRTIFRWCPNNYDNDGDEPLVPVPYHTSFHAHNTVPQLAVSPFCSALMGVTALDILTEYTFL